MKYKGNIKQYSPGDGWKHISGPVYENKDGSRIHLIGLIRLPDGKFKNLNQYPGGDEGRRMIKINGGNRKRGLMAWARRVIWM